MGCYLSRQTLNIGISGLGIIGGSMAKALKKHTEHVVYGYDINDETIRLAQSEGAIDGTLSQKNLSLCDVVFLGLYPRNAVQFVEQNLSYLKRGCILMDLCGVKQFLQNRLGKLCAEHGVYYIGGHPMAGKEHWGFSSSDAALFCGASMIVTPDERIPDACLEQLAGLFSSIGFGRMTISTPEDHDRIIAFTSQLAHVVSSAYIKSPTAQKHMGFSAGSYKDLTRVAKLNAQMWTELFLENQTCLVDEIDTIINHLQEYRNAIASNDQEKLYQLLEDGRKIKEALDK